MEVALIVVFILFVVCVLAWVVLGGNTSVGIHTVKPKDPWEQVNLKATKSGRWIECERPNYPKPPPPAPPRPRTVSPSKPEGWK